MVAIATRPYVARSFADPDEIRLFDKGKVEVVHVGETVVCRYTLQPGWRWALHVKPIAKTAWCEVSHFQYVVSGQLHIRMSDGKEFEIGPDEVVFLPPGHDGWVVGDAPVVLIDWGGAADYARR